jgi:hypothetical protein
MLPAWAQAIPPVQPQGVHVEIVFLKAKSDGSGFDPRIKAPLGSMLRSMSKGSPSSLPAFDRFDSYEWVGADSRDLRVNENASIPVPSPQNLSVYLEYRGTSRWRESGRCAAARDYVRHAGQKRRGEEQGQG